MVAVDGLLTLSAAKEMRMALDRLGKPLHAGTSYDPHARTQAFHWRKGKLSALPILRGFAGCRGLAINSRGQTLGYCSADKPFRVHSVLWQGTGPPRDLGTLDDKDWVYPLELNERGQVVGMTRVDGQTTAF